MTPSTLARDTTPEVERMQIEAWRRMSAEEKAAIVTGLTDAVVRLAVAGIRQRHPDATPHEQRLRLALLMLGPELARAVFPDVAKLDMP
jgi:hypothetical protein